MRTYGKYNISSLNKADRIYKDIVFDSSQEKRYYVEVILPGLSDGSIVYFERQKTYILQASFRRNGKKVLPIEYKADFYIEYQDGTQMVIDIKGYPDAVALVKRKMFWFVYPSIDYVWLSYTKKTGWVTYEEKQQDIRQRRKLKKEEKRRLEDGKK